MFTIASDVQCIRKHGIVAQVWWTYSLKREKFLELGLVGFIRVRLKVRP